MSLSNDLREVFNGLSCQDRMALIKILLEPCCVSQENVIHIANPIIRCMFAPLFIPGVTPVLPWRLAIKVYFL